jgi:predicted transposase YdaD
MLYDVLQESKAYQKIKQEGREEGLFQGRKEGELQALRQALLAIVETYFPTIARLATKRTTEVQDPVVLQNLIVKVGRAQTLEEARQYLLALDEEQES